MSQNHDGLREGNPVLVRQGIWVEQYMTAVQRSMVVVAVAAARDGTEPK
ncbi:hypothetical protein L195_g062458, partial [Trifolium pratense]